MLKLLLRYGIGKGKEIVDEAEHEKYMQALKAMADAHLLMGNSEGLKLNGIDTGVAAPAAEGGQLWKLDLSGVSKKSASSISIPKAPLPTPADVQRVVSKIAEGLLDANSALKAELDESDDAPTSSETAEAVRKSWGRSLLSTNFDNLGALFAAAESSPASTTASTASIDNISLDDLPDLDAIGSLLDKLEGKGTGGKGSIASVDTFADTAGWDGFRGSYRGEDTAAVIEPATDTTSQADLQKYRRHKPTPHHLPDDLPKSTVDNSPPHAYQAPATQHKKVSTQKPAQRTLGGDSYTPHQVDSYAPTPQYGHKEQKYEQQYTPPPSEQYNQQTYHSGPALGPDYAPAYGQDSYQQGPDTSAYTPKRLQRSWNRQYQDQEQPLSEGSLGEGADYGHKGSSLLDDAQNILDRTSQDMLGSGSGLDQQQRQQQHGRGRMSHGLEDFQQQQQQQQQQHGSEFSEQPQRFRPHKEGGEGGDFGPPRRGQAGTSGPALVLVTNTAREKGGG
jgi:hypothetical protein